MRDACVTFQLLSCPHLFRGGAFTRMLRRLFLSACFAAFGVAGARAAEPTFEVNVNGGFGPEGKKLPPPDAKQPVYYYPLVAGWTQKGALIAGEQKPPTKPVVHQLARALAEQGYLVIDREHPTPSLLLVFHWGTVNPEIEDDGVPGGREVFYNQTEMVALLGGHTLGMLDLDFEREAVLQGAKENRYFVAVSAYDFAAARQKKKVLLWSTRMSTPSDGRRIAEVLPGLIAKGGPRFGRETLRPVWESAPLAREASVEVGTPTVVDDAAKAAPPAGKKK